MSGHQPLTVGSKHEIGALQIGYRQDDGSYDWQTPKLATFDTRSNLRKRWKGSGTWAALHTIETLDGYERDAFVGCPEVRHRLIWRNS